MTSRTALRGASLHLSTRMRAVHVIADAKFLYGFDLFVLFIQTGAWNALLEEADESVFVGIIEQFVNLWPIHPFAFALFA